ncbi:MFS transporter [Stappia sp. TSB10P1A]|uniref:MFS transporter n=1 Tax=Stappia sp. TSB10P1A TaxID=2003585 RepID=UPI001643AFB6|nr:MFS transporter [Stappia sp. TSB10P1A]
MAMDRQEQAGAPAHVMLALAANAFHQAALVAMVPVLQQIFGLGLTPLGLLVGAGLALAAIAVPLWGGLARRRGVDLALRASLIGACTGVGLLVASVWATAAGMLPVAAGLALLILARLVYSLTAPAALPLAQAMGAQRAAAATLTAIGRANAVTGLGRLAGNGLVAPLLLLGPALPLALPLPVYVAALIGSLRHSAANATGSGRSAAGETGRATEREIGGARKRMPLPLAPLATAFTLQLALGAASVLLAPLIRDRLALAPDAAAGAAGLCLMLAVAVGIVMQLMLRRLAGERLTGALLAGTVAAGLGLAALGRADALPAIALAIALVSAGAVLALGANTARALLAAGAAAPEPKPEPAPEPEPAPGADQPAGRGSRAQAATWIASLQFAGLAAGAVVAGILGDIGFPLAFAVLTATLAALALALAAGALAARRGRTAPGA